MTDVVRDLFEQRVQWATIAEQTLAFHSFAEEALVDVNEAHCLHELKADEITKK